MVPMTGFRGMDDVGSSGVQVPAAPSSPLHGCPQNRGQSNVDTASRCPARALWCAVRGRGAGSGVGGKRVGGEVVGYLGETEAPQRLDVGTIRGHTRGRGKLLGEPFGSLSACTRTIEPVARRQHRAEQQRLGEIEPGTEVRSNADLLG